jgi:hypothetical protein
MISAENWNDLQRWLCGQAVWHVLGLEDGSEELAYAHMLKEPDVVSNWWEGAFESSEEDEAAITAGAKAVAHEQPLPELTPAQRGRLALRLRLASRIARAMSSRHQKPAKGWFTDRLSGMSESDAIEWLLTDGCAFWIEVFDETLSWADSVEHPKPYIRLTRAEIERYNLQHGPAQ